MSPGRTLLCPSYVCRSRSTYFVCSVWWNNHLSLTVVVIVVIGRSRQLYTPPWTPVTMFVHPQGHHDLGAPTGPLECSLQESVYRSNPCKILDTLYFGVSSYLHRLLEESRGLLSLYGCRACLVSGRFATTRRPEGRNIPCSPTRGVDSRTRVGETRHPYENTHTTTSFVGERSNP